MHLIKKYLMALTGLFLSFFLIVHLSANFLLLLPQSIAPDFYNSYSDALRSNPLIEVVSIFLYLAIILHTIVAINLTLRNRSKTEAKYYQNHSNENSSWSSQNMGLLGLMILVFIVIHMANFWAKVKLGIDGPMPIDAKGHIDIYLIVTTALHNPILVAFYTIMSIPLAMHLSHGVASAFRSLGLYHKRYLRYIEAIARIYSWIMGLGFGLIPIYIYFFTKA